MFQLFQLFGDEASIGEMEAMYRRGGFGYGEVKKALADAAEKYFAGPRARRQELEARPDTVRDILREGARRARERAAQVLDRAEQACGISAPK